MRIKRRETRRLKRRIVFGGIKAVWIYGNPRHPRNACSACNALFTIVFSSLLPAVAKSSCSRRTRALSARRIRPGKRPLSVSNSAVRYKVRHSQSSPFSVVDGRGIVLLLADGRGLALITKTLLTKYYSYTRDRWMV